MSSSECGTTTDEPAWVDEVLRFWFDELDEAHWFAKSAELDARIRQRFLPLHAALLGEQTPIARTPRGLLAAVIVLDQFSRNMFRGSPRAYAADALALQLAGIAVEQGHDQAVGPRERLFFYLPFQHSEDRADQELALRLVIGLGRDDLTHFAEAHKRIIDRFGRFPHRNGVLGRVSTEEEIVLLQEPGNSF
jgi:uncharacterized protein (DUF924 family)